MLDGKWFPTRIAILSMLSMTVLTGVLFASAQDEKAKQDDTKAQDEKKQDQPPVQGPKRPPEQPPRNQPPQQQRSVRQPTVVTYPIQEISKYRGGTTLNVPRHDERSYVDLSDVDFDADVIALVNDQPLTQNDFKRRCVLLGGSAELDQFITYVLTKRRIDEAIAAGADPKQFDVSEKELNDAVEQKKQFAPQFFQKSGEEWEKLVREQFGWDRFLELERVNLAFGKVFLPDYDEKGGELPEYTRELLEPQMATTIGDYYKKGQALPYIFKSTFLQQIRAALLKKASLVYSFETELPDDILMTIDGQQVSTEELWVLVKARLGENELNLVLRDALVSMAVDQALAEQGFLLSADERAEAFNTHRAKYEGTLFPLQLVITLKGFTSMHKYREFYGRKAGFASFQKSGFPGGKWDTALEEYYKSGTSRLTFESGRVRSDAIFIATKDPTSGEVREGGIPGAVMRAEDIKKRALVDKEHFGALLVEASDLPAGQDVDKGRFGIKNRYELKKALGESEYTVFVNSGYSLADEVFFCGMERDIIGPVVKDFPSEKAGVYLVRVDHFQNRQTDKVFSEVRETVENDFVDIGFQNFVHDACKKARFELTRRAK